MYRNRLMLVAKRLLHMLSTRRMNEEDLLEQSLLEYMAQREGGLEQVAEQEQLSLSSYIEMMSPEERKDFRNKNPELPDFVFMTNEEKKKFFEGKNRDYLKKLSKSKQRHSKSQKIVKFSDHFDVRSFEVNKKVFKVAKAQTVPAQYEDYHFS